MFTQQTLQGSSESMTPPISKHQVGEMFAKWKIYFKSKMKDEEWGLTNILLWTAVLNEFNVTEQELIEGTTKACFAKELKGWPPTTATDFIEIFRDTSASEYPDVRKSYEHAVDYSGRLFDDRKNWRHVVIYETAKRIGFTKLAINPERLTWVLWRDVYTKVCADHKAGVEMNLPIDKSRQLENVHTPVSADNEAVNDFIKKYGSKKGKAS